MELLEPSKFAVHKGGCWTALVFWSYFHFSVFQGILCARKY